MPIAVLGHHLINISADPSSAQQISPSTSISIGALIWALGASCQAAVQNPAGLYVCRLFVGVGEAMFGQSMALYLAMWYSKTELAKRVGLFSTCPPYRTT